MMQAEDQRIVIACERCGNSVPASNYALHSLRCRGTLEQKHDEEKDQQFTPPKTPKSIENANSASDVKLDNTSTECSGTMSSCISPISARQQWECRHCTFLNTCDEDTSSSRGELPHHCAMCENSRYLSDTWRNNQSLINANNEEEEVEVNCGDVESDSDSDSEEEEEEEEEGNDSEDGAALLDTWTCVYCTVVNMHCDDSCQMCDMPNRSSSRSPHQVASSNQHHPPSALRETLGVAAPALCYLGLTAGALLADVAGGSASSRTRSGLLGSLVGTMAGLAVAVLLAHDEEVPPSHQPPTSSARSNSDAAARLPVHRFQGCSDDKMAGTVVAGRCSSARRQGGTHGELADGDKRSCQVCMEEYVQDVEVKTLKCFHMFHAECIDQWLLLKSSCPLCCTEI